MRTDTASSSGASMPAPETDADIAATMREMGIAAKKAASVLATASAEQKRAALEAAADALDARAELILAANARDMAAARETVGMYALPGGDDWYAFNVKARTTTDLTPDEIHQIGLDEVADGQVGHDEPALTARRRPGPGRRRRPVAPRPGWRRSR